MNLSKSLEYFNPEDVKGRIHIIGCGSVGSTLAENLARNGITNFTLWDFDKVESKNIVNQMFTSDQVGMPKVEALRDLLVAINPEIAESIKLMPNGWDGERLSGYVMLAVDNIELRKKICQSIDGNRYVKAVFDFRTMLEGAQHYAADWSNYKQRKNLMSTMNFTHEEAEAETPRSACGTTLGVATTVRLICALGVNNFMNFVKGKKLQFCVNMDGFNFILDACE